MKKSFDFWKWNRWTGFIVALVSFVIYVLTLEPAGSFWDCGEFLSCANRLEVCHSPGAPLFLLTGRLAAIIAGSDITHIALFINAVSALASALTVAFLFWSITWFGRKLLANTWDHSNNHKIYILISGVVGALAFAFSDSFWFSAVEAEVYAMSSMFTALVVWCILKWEECPDDDKNADRWLLLIAYLTGLSIGVHLLNLLTIPAVVMVYSLKNYGKNIKNILLSFVVGVGILGFVLFILIPGIPSLFSFCELISVNNFHLPFNTGYYLGIILFIGIITTVLVLFRKNKMIRSYNALVLLALMITGYSIYGLVVIRAHDNPPINMTSPESPFALENYLNREQYEQRPLFYGPSFNSRMIDTKDRFSYQRFNNKYITFPLIPEYIYDPNSLILFPRMYSNSSQHTDIYKEWSGFKDKSTSISVDGASDNCPGANPTFAENMKFFVRYQLGFMYFRYFMWNFSGKQNDIQGHGENIHGNWITGLSFIDKYLVGTDVHLPTTLKHNPGNNKYFMLPLILGLIGMWFQYRLNKQNFGMVSLLFFFTGIAIVFYLNEVPSTPRERDYVFVGSFYFFCIWIGLGAVSILFFCEKYKFKNVFTTFSLVFILAVPIIMLVQNYDDHNRSRRYVVREYARNYLESCAPNAILFTNADNDTYPLWYAQEVEGIRRDVRIVLAPYLGADWYTDQMRKTIGNNKGLKMNLGADKYIQGKRSYLPIHERLDTSIEVSEFIEFAGSDDERAKITIQNGETMNFVPSRKLFLSFDKNKIHDFDKFSLPKVDSIAFLVKGKAMRMDQLVLLDILSSNNWGRPVYFSSAQVPYEMGLENYLQLDGYAYRLIPCKKITNGGKDIGFIDTKSLYNKYMHDFKWTSLSDPKVYLDCTHINMLHILSLRDKFAGLAETLINEKEYTKAIEVLDKIMEILPLQRIGNDSDLTRVAEAYLKAGEMIKGNKLLVDILNMQKENCNYFNSLPIQMQGGLDYEIRLTALLFQESIRIADLYHITKTYTTAIDYWKGEEYNLIKMLKQ